MRQMNEQTNGRMNERIDGIVPSKHKEHSKSIDIRTKGNIQSKITINQRIIDEMLKSDFNEAYRLWFVK